MATTNLKPLPPSSLQHRADFKRNRWFVSIPAGVALSDLEQPELWQHADKYLENDLIEAVSESGDFDALLRVVTVGNAFCVTRIIWSWQRDAVMFNHAAVGAGKAGVEYLPDRGAWIVFGSDGSEVGQYQSEQDAVAMMTIEGEAA